VWLHAVSAGEVTAAQPVLEALGEALPGARVAMSTVTRAGMEVARKTCRGVEAFFYLPMDAVCTMACALARVRPHLVVVAEKELWPNFLGLARLFGAKVLVVNGRVSDRMMGRARWAPGFVQWLYRLPDRLCVQSEQDAARLRSLGVVRARIRVAGNTKVDSMAEPDQEATARLAREIGVSGEERWLVAGSTHPGEEEVVLEGFRRIREEMPQARLLLAPRHLERVAAVSALVAERGWAAVRRSERRADHGSAPVEGGGKILRCAQDDKVGAQDDKVGAQDDKVGGADSQVATGGDGQAVVVLDTMGELRATYGFATVGFVGGTLAPIGGHNLLEPVAAGRAVLFGPHTESCADMAELVLEARVGFRIESAAGLAGQFLRIAREGRLRDQIAAAGLALIQEQRGAARRCAEVARELLEEGP
jgi:3-deoxy-D-manno-octulosonic-acid transferase